MVIMRIIELKHYLALKGTLWESARGWLDVVSLICSFAVIAYSAWFHFFNNCFSYLRAFLSFAKIKLSCLLQDSCVSERNEDCTGINGQLNGIDY